MPANVLYTPQQVAATTAALVEEEMGLSALVSRNMEDDLLGGGGKGRVVNIKIPTALIAHVREIDDVTNSIIMDYINEQTVALRLGVHAYNAVPLSEGDLNLDLKSFAAQILAPQSEGVAQYVESVTRGLLLADANDATAAGKWSTAAPLPFFTNLRKVLRLRGLSAANLNVVVGAGVYAAALDANLITDASASGSTAALREGQIGRLRGFTIREDVTVPDNFVSAFHRDAFTLAVRAPEVPQGASFGAKVVTKGFGLRYIRDYDADKTVDRSIVSTFVGGVKMPLYKIVRTNDIGSQGDVISTDNPSDPDAVNEVATYVAGNAAVTQVTAGASIRCDVTL